MQPVFITIDPERDTPAQLKRYLAEFSARIVGLWGTMEEVKTVAKAFRVYFMKTNDSEDYLVDHSIIMVRGGRGWGCCACECCCAAPPSCPDP